MCRASSIPLQRLRRRLLVYYYYLLFCRVSKLCEYVHRYLLDDFRYNQKKNLEDLFVDLINRNLHWNRAIPKVFLSACSGIVLNSSRAFKRI